MGGFDLSRRLAAEALGTGALVCTVVGSGIMADRLTDDMALALLANALPTGAILVVIITMFAPVSGAHFNPAVTLGLTLTGRLPVREAGPYAAAQIGGGLLGTLAAHLMFALPLVQTSLTERTGPSQWFAEGVATFGLMAAILAAIRFRPKSVAWMVGLYITAAYWFTASTSFANPAVTVARAFTDTFSGIRPLDAPAFVMAQLAGATCAVAVMTWLLNPRAALKTAAKERVTQTR